MTKIYFQIFTKKAIQHDFKGTLYIIYYNIGCLKPKKTRIFELSDISPTLIEASITKN